MMSRVENLTRGKGLSAAVFTQFSDVEVELPIEKELPDCQANVLGKLV